MITPRALLNASTLQVTAIKPMLAAHVENLLFLLLLVGAGLLQLLGRTLRKPNTTDKQSPAPKPLPTMPKPNPRAGRESDQERIRKLLEALGQPQDSGPPPPVAQRPTYRKPLVLQRIPPLRSPLPPLVTRPPELAIKPNIPPASVAPPAQTFGIHEPEAPAQSVPNVAVSPIAERATQTQIATKAPSLGLRRLFGSSSSLRDAIIVREVLGPPRALQEFE
jgi:hypothetical protein